jgi:hypothetical protein
LGGGTATTANKGGGANGARTGTGGVGTANTGGGGGGGSYDGTRQNGGAGGSGVVIIAYPDSFAPLTSIGGTLFYDQPTRSGYRVYRFTSGTGNIQW